MRSWSRVMLFLLMLVLVSGAAVLGEAQTAGGTLVVAMAGDADTLDPHVTGARRAYTIMMNIFDTLVYRDTDGTYVPGLATAWEHNADGTVYTFELLEGVTFHDGTAFNAEAVVFNLDRIIDPAIQSKFASDAIGPYESSTALDEYTVQVNFSSGIALSVLLDSLSQAYLSMVSPTAVEEWGEDFGRHPVGTGPFVFEEWTAQNHVRLSRNDAYDWASPVFEHEGAAYLEGIEFVTILEDTTRAATLETGESDVVLELGEEAVLILGNDPAYQLVDSTVPGCPIIFWMNVEHPILQDVNVRKAILYGFSSDLLCNTVYRGLATPCYGPLAPGTWAYNPAVEDMYPYDPELARTMLDNAGWIVNPATGIREKDGVRLSLDANDITEKRRIEFFQAMMQEIGVDIDARAVTSDILYQITREADTYSIASTWWAYSDPDVLRILYHSTNIGTGFAISRYNDPALDAMLEAALAEMEPSERVQDYYAIQEFIMEKALLVPIYARLIHDGLQSNVRGYRTDRGQYPVLFDVSLEP